MCKYRKKLKNKNHDNDKSLITYLDAKAISFQSIPFSDQLMMVYLRDDKEILWEPYLRDLDSFAEKEKWCNMHGIEYQYLTIEQSKHVRLFFKAAEMGKKGNDLSALYLK